MPSELTCLPACPVRRFDMGTADEIALDMLINSLDTFSRECVRRGGRVWRQLLMAAFVAGIVASCSWSSAA